ncbi:response regulator [Virgibacillus kekensis]|uniref:Response regulator n=1 Tax=Virgibacillus kekensis TaxID=202261 RepID=A0ABV9DHE2_9BACI
MLNVFIAEDDFRIADIHEQFISKINGVRVVGKALNGEDTINALTEQPVDLLLLDIYMPDKLGVEVITELRTKGLKDIDIIVITAANERNFLEESLRSGVFSYLIKPVLLDKFVEEIERYKEYKKLLNSQDYVDQEFVDSLLITNSNEPQINEQQHPKGIDPLTLKKVTEIMDHLKDGITAEEIRMKMGASRTTARRYLEYLVSTGEINAELEYGVVGRPERKYYRREN